MSPFLLHAFKGEFNFVNKDEIEALVGGGAPAVASRPLVKGDHDQVGRNDPCWCGSGKKYKRCHGS